METSQYFDLIYIVKVAFSFTEVGVFVELVHA